MDSASSLIEQFRRSSQLSGGSAPYVEGLYEDWLADAGSVSPEWGAFFEQPAEAVAKFGSDTPMKRPAQPEEIAPAYVFLASSHCSTSSKKKLKVTFPTPLFIN